MEHANRPAVTAESPATQKIPLICSICPKNTKFSDVSHLLTHISSKGHLSAMFKLDIAKYTDADARARLDEYQAWFEENNIRDLLQSRSENRIQKNAGGKGRAGTRGGSQSANSRGGHATVVSRKSTGKNIVARDKRVSHDLCISYVSASLQGFLTGPLVQHVRRNAKQATSMDFVKREPENDFDTISDFAAASHAHIRQPWNPGGHGQTWPTPSPWTGAYYGHDFQQDLGFDISLPNEDEGTEDHEETEASAKGDLSDVLQDEDEDSSNFLRSEDTMDTTFPGLDTSVPSEGHDDEERERIHFRKYLKGDISKLEGVGGFDAAPEDQRRKRNQKKDPSVLVHMEASSRAVRTIEQVTDLNFNHIRWRDVYDEPSIDGSEVCPWNWCT
jgi:hypothetical protein